MRDDRYAQMLDAISDEVEDLHNRMPNSQLALFLEKRADDLTPGTPGRAEWLAQAGETWELAGEPSRARACYERSIDDDGPVWIDGRALLLGVLFDLGDTERTEPLVDELRRDAGRGRARGPVHDFVGETLELNGRLNEALRWFNAGVNRAEQEDEDLTVCLNGRYRVRRALDLPLDRYDVLCEERRREARDELELGRRPRSAEGLPPMTLLYWPPAQLSRLLDRWPAMSEEYGSDVSGHRSLVERHLRKLADRGAGLEVGTGDVDEYVEWSAGKQRDPADSATRAGFAAHLGLSGRTTPWPPRRNEPCWCGSGLKYKKCCGALRFSAAEPD